MDLVGILRGLFGKPTTMGIWEYVCPKCHIAKVSIDIHTTACNECGGIIHFPHYIELTIHRNKIIKAEGIY